MSYTSESRGRPCGLCHRSGVWSPEHRPAEIVQQRWSAKSSRALDALQVTALSGSLSHSQPGKNTHVEVSSGARPSTSRDLQTRTARSFELNRSGHLGGTRMHKSRETGTGSFGTRHCQAQFVPTDGRRPTSRSSPRPGTISTLIYSLNGRCQERLKFGFAAAPGALRAARPPSRTAFEKNCLRSAAPRAPQEPTVMAADGPSLPDPSGVGHGRCLREEWLARSSDTRA